MIEYLLILIAVLTGFSAGFVVGRFGYIAPKALDGNQLLAVELSRTNNMGIRK